MRNLTDEVNQNRRHIKYDALTFSLSELVRMYENEPKEMQIRPAYQRLFRWTREQQSSFIESLLLEIPVPPLFFFESESGVWELIDGLQRLSTIIRFFAGLDADVPASAAGPEGNQDSWHYTNQNELTAPLQLVAGEKLQSLDGITFKGLSAPLQLNLKRARLHVYVLKRETDEIFKYDVFKRLNSGGTGLEPQELRNCSVRLLSDEFPEFLQTISKDENYQKALGASDLALKNGDIEELALRYFAVKNAPELFRHDVDGFLTGYMEGVARKNYPFVFNEERELFQKLWALIFSFMPEGEAFRGKKANGSSVGQLSPALFEIVTYGLTQNFDRIANLPSETLRSATLEVIRKAKDQGLTGSGTNTIRKFNARLSLGKEHFA